MYQIIELFEAPTVRIVVTNGQGKVEYDGDSPADAKAVYNGLVANGEKPSSTTKVTAIEWTEKKPPSLENPEHVKHFLSKLPARVQHVYNSILQKKPAKAEEIALAQKFHPHYFKQ